MKRAVLLLNMGGPNSIDEVELFLKNMFDDKNILPLNRYLRKVVAKKIINSRLKEAQENYQMLGGKSPLNDITNSLAKKIEAIIDLPVRLAMRYVPPFASETLKEFKEGGIDEIILFPMYPHYSTTTTLSSFEDIEQRCKEINYFPKLHLIKSYYDDYNYLAIQAEQIIQVSKNIDTKDFDLILSAHGLPISIIRNGDPYEKQIEANKSALKTYLNSKGIYFKNIKLAYQSKVGKSAWLEPNLIDILRQPKNLKVLIFPLAFTIDNSETLFELDIEHRDIAKKIGYKEYLVVPCPNDDDDFANFVVKKVKESIDKK